MSRKRDPFKSSCWEDRDYIVSGIAPGEKSWLDTPLGHVVSKPDGAVIAKWLNGLDGKELRGLSRLFVILADEFDGPSTPDNPDPVKE